MYLCKVFINPKIKDMSYTLKLKVPDYLKWWFVNEHGGNEPVNLIRGSHESNVIEHFLRKQPLKWEEEKEANLVINIPNFKSVDVRTYNYLPIRARAVLVSSIHTSFKVQLWEELHTLDNSRCEIMLLIEAFMEKHNIPDTEKNEVTIKQMYYRMRDKFGLAKRRKKKDKKTDALQGDLFNNEDYIDDIEC